ncbi:anti-sigma factor [Rhodococcus sp. NPDC003318]|uniref:anti-sigma factor n=1 Tax=Rhodococcus sp. NPDC003318 TaxID=3364503 RepID=UPI0036BA6D31
MTEWLDMAEIYALDAVSESERAEIDSQLAAATSAQRAEFERRVRDVRETMAGVSASTAAEPPPQLRARLLAEIAAAEMTADDAPLAVPIDLAAKRREHRGARGRRLRTAALAAAAAIVVAVGGAVVATRGLAPEPEPTAEQVFAADDVRTTSGQIEGGGTATVVYSKDVGAGVLVMNNVAPPAEGTVYQMWLLGGTEGPRPAGTMDAEAVAPSTTAVLEDIGDSTALGFTVEPPGGSTQPTGPVFAELPLT